MFRPSLFPLFFYLQNVSIFLFRENVLSTKQLPWQQNGACYEFTQANEYKGVLDRCSEMGEKMRYVGEKR